MEFEIMEIEEVPAPAPVTKGKNKTVRTKKKCRTKKDSINWKEKYFQCQNQLVEYEMKLSKCMRNMMSLQENFEALKKVHQKTTQRESALTVELEMKEAELRQLRSFSKLHCSCDKDRADAEKQILNMTKDLNKMKKCYSDAMELITKQKKIIHNVTLKNKKIKASPNSGIPKRRNGALSIKQVSYIESHKAGKLSTGDVCEKNDVCEVEKIVFISNFSCSANNDESVIKEEVSDTYLDSVPLTNDNLLSSNTESVDDNKLVEAAAANISDPSNDVSSSQLNEVQLHNEENFKSTDSSRNCVSLSSTNSVVTVNQTLSDVNSTSLNKKPVKTKQKKKTDSNAIKIKKLKKSEKSCTKKSNYTIKKAIFISNFSCSENNNETVIKQEVIDTSMDNLPPTNGNLLSSNTEDCAVIEVTATNVNPSNDVSSSQLNELSDYRSDEVQPHNEEVKSTDSSRNSMSSSNTTKPLPTTAIPDCPDVNSNSNKKPLKTKQKKLKDTNTIKIKKQKKTEKSCKEGSNCAIKNALQSIKKVTADQSNYRSLQDNLVNALVNPANAPNTRSALYQLFSFICSSKSNLLTSYLVNCEISVFYPLEENCIVEALIETANKKETHLEGLIPSALHTLYYMILTKKTLSKTGLSALCRVFTRLCKHINDQEKPINLACDLIKEQHPQGPVLIAFIIAIWVEIFEQKRDKEEWNLLFLSSIFFCLNKKLPTVSRADWRACKAVFQLPCAVPLPMDFKATTDIIITTMQEIVNEPPSATDAWTSNQILMFASAKGWEWTEENVVPFVMSSLRFYSKNKNNERAFSFFAELAGDIGKVAPNDCLTVVKNLTTLFMDNCEYDYVKKHSAYNLLKILVYQAANIPLPLVQYIEENAANLQSSTNIELCLKRRCIADEDKLREEDILLV